MAFIPNSYFYKKLFQLAAAFGAAVFLICPAHSQTAANAPNGSPANASKTKAISFTEEDRENGLKYLEETKAEFLREISGLSDAQLNFRENADRWSVAEVAEHIVLAENRIFSLITENVLKADTLPCNDSFRLKDTAIWMVVTNRNTKFTAPEAIRPKGAFKSKADILKGFNETRGRTLDFLKNTRVDLRNRFGELPIIGAIDGFQWFLFINAHNYRHLEQIREIKAHPRFPAE